MKRRELLNRDKKTIHRPKDCRQRVLMRMRKEIIIIYFFTSFIDNNDRRDVRSGLHFFLPSISVPHSSDIKRYNTRFFHSVPFRDVTNPDFEVKPNSIENIFLTAPIVGYVTDNSKTVKTRRKTIYSLPYEKNSDPISVLNENSDTKLVYANQGQSEVLGAQNKIIFYFVILFFLLFGHQFII